MRIATTFENGRIFEHFGHTEQIKLYDIDGTAVLSSKVVNTNGSGHGALVQFLKDHKVDALICGGIGQGAKNALMQEGIQLYGGVAGEADEAVKALLENRLQYSGDVTCNHHEHGHAHHNGVCGPDGCGHHHGHGHCH